MGSINVSLPSDGETIEAADYNTPINTIVNEINGELDNSNIASDAAIDGSKLANTSITNAKLATGAGEPGGAWTAWTPTLSGRLNNSKWTKNCTYTQIGKTIHFRFGITASTTSPMDGGTADVFFTLPVTAVAPPTVESSFPIGVSRMLDSGSAAYFGSVEQTSTTLVRMRWIDTSAAASLGIAPVTSTSPFTWTTNDEIVCSGTYEAA